MRGSFSLEIKNISILASLLLACLLLNLQVAEATEPRRGDRSVSSSRPTTSSSVSRGVKQSTSPSFTVSKPRSTSAPPPSSRGAGSSGGSWSSRPSGTTGGDSSSRSSTFSSVRGDLPSSPSQRMTSPFSSPSPLGVATRPNTLTRPSQLQESRPTTFSGPVSGSPSYSGSSSASSRNDRTYVPPERSYRYGTGSSWHHRRVAVTRSFGWQVNPWSRGWRPPIRDRWIWMPGQYRYGYWCPGYWIPSQAMIPAGFVYVPGWWVGQVYFEGYYRPQIRRDGDWIWIEGYYLNDGSYVWGHWMPANPGPPGHVWEPGFYNGETYVDGFWRPQFRQGFVWISSYYSLEGVFYSGYWSSL